MTLYERMKKTCIDKGYNFKQLEMELGFGNGTLRKWEKQNPSYDKVITLANKLNVNLEWLLTGIDSGNQELPPDERILLEYYRNADSRGKHAIMRTAEDEGKLLTSSNSQTG